MVLRETVSSTLGQATRCPHVGFSMVALASDSPNLHERLQMGTGAFLELKDGARYSTGKPLPQDVRHQVPIVVALLSKEPSMSRYSTLLEAFARNLGLSVQVVLRIQEVAVGKAAPGLAVEVTYLGIGFEVFANGH